MPRDRQRLPLTALRTFEVAARTLSFKLAAEELHVSPATVSNQIRQLERAWGFPLFIRKTRHVLLTEAGRSLARVIGRAFDDIRTEVAAHGTSTRRTVDLAVGPIFGARWLIPRLNRFYRRHPDVELMLHHGPRISGAEQMTATIAVDWGRGGGWSGLEATHLLDIVYVPVVSPALLKERGRLRAPADLSRFPIIHQHDRAEWYAWLRLAGCPDLRFAEETVVLDSNVVTQAAIDGQGVALGIFPFIDPEVASGRLVRPFGIELHPDRAYHLLTRPGARRSPEIRAVCDWLLEEAAATASR